MSVADFALAGAACSGCSCAKADSHSVRVEMPSARMMASRVRKRRCIRSLRERRSGVDLFANCSIAEMAGRKRRILGTQERGTIHRAPTKNETAKDYSCDLAT